MGRWKRKSEERNNRRIKEEIYTIFSRMFQNGKGRSRHADKDAGEDRGRIYSERTYRTYMQQAKQFRKWIRENHGECSKLKDCKAFINEYLTHLIEEGKSAYTITTAKSALCKLFQCDFSEFIETPGRYRRNITRSRIDAIQDAHISEKTEKYWAQITSATGLRRAELSRITGTDLFSIGEKYYLRVTKGTKGGRSRTSEVLDLKILPLFQYAGDRPVFPNVPKSYDNHHYRGIYAKRLYNQYARPIEDIPAKDRYVMRKDRKGVVLDKKAMRIVSQNLGHTRIDVIAQHYLY